MVAETAVLARAFLTAIERSASSVRPERVT
jgi:hypothetical protein